MTVLTMCLSFRMMFYSCIIAFTWFAKVYSCIIAFTWFAKVYSCIIAFTWFAKVVEDPMPVACQQWKAAGVSKP